VDLYNFTTGQWTQKTLSPSFSDPTVAVVDNQVVIAGGILPNNQDSNTVNIFNAITGQWSTHTLAYAAYDMSAAGSGNLLVLAGGATEGTDIPAATMYNAHTGEWSTDWRALSQARAHPITAVVDGKMIFAGGYTTNSESQVVDVYDTGTGRWSTTAPLVNTPFNGFGTGVTVGSTA
jgi:hypothetical protein